jgi:hypothetical protein
VVSIRRTQGSNLGHDNGYPEGLRDLPTPHASADILPYIRPQNFSFQILYNPLFTNTHIFNTNVISANKIIFKLTAYKYNNNINM